MSKSKAKALNKAKGLSHKARVNMMESDDKKEYLAGIVRAKKYEVGKDIMTAKDRLKK